MGVVLKELSIKLDGTDGKHISSFSQSKAPDVEEETFESIEDYTLLKVIGRGSFGKVFLAESNETKTLYAIKVVNKDFVIRGNDVDTIMTERNVLKLGVRNPFLTNLHSTFQNSSSLFFVMEYVCGGDLMFHIMEEGRFSLERAKFYAAEIVLAFQFLHRKGIIYRDLKLDNIMLDSEGHIKLTDFGMCKEGIKNGRTTSTFCGTPVNMAPEIIREEEYSIGVDWWTLGILIYGMLVGHSPFHDENEDRLFEIIKREAPFFPPNIDVNSKRIIRGLLQKDPNQRLGCPPQSEEAIKEQQFFKGIKWDELQYKRSKPPFIPAEGERRNADNFDLEFTSEPVEMSVSDARSSASETGYQEEFRGFDYVNNKV